MNAYLIDTSVIINFLKNKKETVETIENLEGEVTSSFICLAELYEGVLRSREREKVEEGIMTFFAGLSTVYGVDYEIAKIFGQLRSELKRKGMIIEDFDLLLAATCLAYNLTLVTLNAKHFRRIKNLQILEPQKIPELS